MVARLRSHFSHYTMPRGRRAPATNGGTGLPPALEACLSGWTETDLSQKAFVLMSEDEFFEAFQRPSLAGMYQHFADRAQKTLRLQGLDQTPTNTYKLLVPDSIIASIVEFTNPALHLAGHARTNILEYRSFIHHLHLVGLYKTSLDLTFSMILPSLAKENYFQLIDISRFKALLTHTKCFSMEGRSPSDHDETWIQKRTFMKQLHEFEEMPIWRRYIF